MYTLHGRVGASGTDLNGIMRLGAALDMIQDCSLHWMDSQPEFTEHLRQTNTVILLVSRQVDIVRLPSYGEQLTAETRVYDCRPFFGYRNTSIYDADGNPCVLTWSVGAFVDRSSGRIARLSPEILDTILLDDKIPMEYLDKKIALPDTSWQRLNAIPIRRGDIDFNKHMNNAKYVEVALELLPEDAAFSRLRIEYKVPAKPGEILHPQLCATPDGKYYILLSDAQGHPYTIMEFS